jgi:hypothetical protein
MILIGQIHKIIPTGVRSIFLFYLYLLLLQYYKDGTKPGNNQNIYIARCTWLIIDCPLPTIRSLRIDGILEFQQVSRHFLLFN